MGANYKHFSDPFIDAIPLAIDSVAVDVVVGGYVGRAFTDLVIDASTNTDVTSATYTFVAGDIGKLLAITSGTGFTADTYVIVAIPSAGKARLSAAVGTVASTAGVGFFASDCRGLLILTAGNVVLSTVKRPAQYETLTAVPVGILPGRIAIVRKASNLTTATNIYSLY